MDCLCLQIHPKQQKLSGNYKIFTRSFLFYEESPFLLLLQKLNKEENRTIVMVLHELNNATKFADYLVGVKDGQVVFSGHPLDVITKDNLRTLYGIEATLQLDESKQYPICVDFNIEK